MESDLEAIKILEDYLHKGWLREFASYEDLATFVGGSPVFSKFACITKTRVDGTVKRRIILDSKKSAVTAASRKQYRSVLPRATDFVTDLLALQATAPEYQEVEIFICDADDAFWQIPLHESERRFYCACLLYTSPSPRD